VKTLLFVISSIFFFVPTETVKKYTLTVKITGIKSMHGLVQIALYKDPEKFPKIGQTYGMKRVKPTSDEMTYHFVNLDAAPYAVCLYHDENNNDQCDKNLIGIPTEGYAFSNNFRPKWSVPTFEDCSFELDKDKTVSIKMVY
jgi:uncharacterized protein (DUF2141 family)